MSEEIDHEAETAKLQAIAEQDKRERRKAEPDAQRNQWGDPIKLNGLLASRAKPKPLPALAWWADSERSEADTTELSPALPKGKVGMLAAPGGAGKTSWLLRLALALTSGKAELDALRFEGTPKKVLVALAEEDEAEMKRRLLITANSLNLSDEERANADEHLTVWPLASKNVRLLDGDGENDDNLPIWDEVANGGYDLVILDPAARFVGPEAEERSEAATDFIRVCEELATSGATVLFAHHANKASMGGNGLTASESQTIQRGSSAFTDGVRWQANMGAGINHARTMERFLRLQQEGNDSGNEEKHGLDEKDVAEQYEEHTKHPMPQGRLVRFEVAKFNAGKARGMMYTIEDNGALEPVMNKKGVMTWDELRMLKARLSKKPSGGGGGKPKLRNPRTTW